MGMTRLRAVLGLLAVLRVVPAAATPSPRFGADAVRPHGLGLGRPGPLQSLPDHLIMCYSDEDLLRREARVPQTMANLVDLLQRVERDPGFVADLRITVTTLLHRHGRHGSEDGAVLAAAGVMLPCYSRFRVDGLERNPLVPASPGVTPYRLTGTQHARHGVLSGRLLPGNANLFPNASLSARQQCALHLMLSSAVDPWERGDEYWICPRVPTPRSNVPSGRRDGDGYGDGNVYWPGHRLYPDPARDISLMGGHNPPPPPPDVSSQAWSACPVEEGVVEAGRGGGAVAAGAVLAGLAAGLQPQAVALSSLLSPRHLERLRADGGRDADTVDNLWAATLAGDLAEVSAYQGPSPGPLALGPAGLWNDSLIPRVRYMSRERPGSPELAPVQRWDMTDAEIRGGFDGLALGSRVARWTERTGRLRLSQLLDMYYSPRGVAFETDVKACNRAAASATAFSPEALQLQTARFARTLTDVSPDAPYMKEEALANFTAASVRAFLRYAGDLLSGDACDSPPLMSVRVNALVVLDTTWTRDAAFQFITHLAGPEGIDVGLFGSRIAVMNGGMGGPVGGHWIVNFTDSPVQLATDWVAVDTDDINFTWPTYLDLPWSLMAVLEHLQSKSEAESAQGTVGSAHGDVVAILATGSTVSDADLRHAKVLVPRIKDVNPDTRMLYVVTALGEARFRELAELRADWDDAVVVVDDVAPDAVAHALANYLREMPGRLMPGECVLAQGEGAKRMARVNTWPVQPGAHVWAAVGVRRGWGASPRALRGQLEDYVSPNQLRLYRVSTAFTRPGVPVSVQLVGEDYGDLRMCMWRGAAPGGAVAAMRAALRAEADGGEEPGAPQAPQAECVNLAGFGEANVTIAEPCGERCAPLYVSVTASRTSLKCTEDDCRYPDEVRYLLRPLGVYCVGSDPGRAAASARGQTRFSVLAASLASLVVQALLVLAVC